MDMSSRPVPLYDTKPLLTYYRMPRVCSCAGYEELPGSLHAGCCADRRLGPPPQCRTGRRSGYLRGQGHLGTRRHLTDLEDKGT